MKFELEQVVEVLKASVEERVETAARAEDPAEREHAVEKLQREAAALGRVEAVQVGLGSPVVTLEDLYAPVAVPVDPVVLDYPNRVDHIMDDRISKNNEFRNLRPELGNVFKRILLKRFPADLRQRVSSEEIVARLGPPEQLVDEWLQRLGNLHRGIAN